MRLSNEQITSKLIIVVADALGVEESDLTPDSSSANTDGWDSLGHLAILSGLDREFDGITSKAPQLGTAESISEMVVVVESLQ